jgi:hypothetical protein
VRRLIGSASPIALPDLVHSAHSGASATRIDNMVAQAKEEDEE